MAGARTVEEILARGGAEQFSITMFGDEPYGNYNRIMLSHVLSGEETDADIFLNSLPWYIENNITLHAGVRATRIDRFSKLVYASNRRRSAVTPYDVLIIATGSRSFMPAIEGLRTDDGELLPGVFAFRTIDDTRGMVNYAQHDDHRRAVVIGGGLLGLEAARGLQAYGLQVDVVHAGAAPDERPDRPGRRRRSCARAWRTSASRCTPRPGPPRSWARTRSAASGCSTTRCSSATWWSSPPVSGRTSISP